MKIRLRVLVVRVALALVVAYAGLTSAGEPMAPAAAASGLELVGRLPLKTTEVGLVIADAPTRQLIILGNSAAFDKVMMWRFDADSLTLVGTAFVPGYFLPGAVPYAWNPATRRLYVVAVSPNSKAGTADTLLTLEGGERLVNKVAINPAAFSAGLSIQGLTYDAFSDRLYMAASVGGGTVGTNLVEVNELNPATGSGWARSYQISSCQKLVGQRAAVAVVRNAQRADLFVGCGTGNLVAAAEPGLPAIARVDFTDPNNPSTTLYPIAGSYAQGASFYDLEGGRLVMVSQGPQVPSQAAWVFDVEHKAFLGNVSAGDLGINGTALADTGGRLYVAITNALLVASDRGIKIGQATKYAFPGLLGARAAVPFNRTVLLEHPVPGSTSENAIFAYRVSAEPYVAPPPSDPDAATTNLAEGPGAASTYGADAKAFGVRVHQVAGLHGVVQNVGPGGESNSFDSLKQAVNSTGSIAADRTGRSEFNYLFPYNDNDRDIYLSRVGVGGGVGGRLSPQEATATAITEDADSYTQQDYESATGKDWPYKSDAARCADFGQPAAGTATDASVSCDRVAGKVTATVTNDGSTFVLGSNTAGDQLLAGSGPSSATTTLVRDAANGVTVHTIATARDVDIATSAGVAHFGEITSVANTAAHGRPGTTKASYTRTFKNVTMPGFSCGDTGPLSNPATNAACQPKDVANQLSAFLGSRFQVEIPGDETVSTPRGARGSSLREPYQHQQDVALNNQATNELQIPALRIIYYNDNASRSRYILEWAGTLADTGYRIFHTPVGGQADLEGLVAGSAVDDFIQDDSTTAALEPGDVGSINDRGDAGDGDHPVVGVTASLPRGRFPGHGLRFLLSGRGAVVLASLLWGMFLLPGFLAGRRRYLLRVIGDTQ